MIQSTNRRKFLASAATAAFTILPRHVLGAPFVPPSDKITMAHIGMGTEGFKELEDLLADPGIQIVAVCDPNKNGGDYVDWSRDAIRNIIRKLMGRPNWGEGMEGIPGGREVGRQVIDTYYANQRSSESFKGCASYADFRELFDREKDLDAVKIMTPDHLHATISIAAMKKGAKVLVHKPLANRLYEARLVIETARKTQVATHFLPWNPSNNLESIRLISSWIKDGAIGPLREVHNWSMRPLWPQYPTVPTERPPVPKDFDWDLWLGPALDRPYHPTYTNALFRGWYDFGGGSLADMGHYSLWSVFTVFDLGVPTSVEAAPSTICSVVDHVSGKLKNDVSFPAACRIRFKFPARGVMPALDLYWYDGGMKPYTPEELEADNKELPVEGMMFVGDRGKILADFLGLNPQIIPEKRMREYQGPKPPAPTAEGPGQETPADRNRVWMSSFRGGPPSPGSFLNAGNISEAVNLGAIALRAGGKIVYDFENMKITNIPEANKYLFREYRKGWEL
jgi:hypothetical protein